MSAQPHKEKHVHAGTLPPFVDMRLMPSALTVWLGCWWGTGGTLRMSHAWGVALLLTLSAAALILWRRHEDTHKPQPRHRLLPSGSLRLSLAVVGVATAGACLLSAHARAAYDADPFHEAFASRHTLDIEVEIIGFPRAHARGSSVARSDITLPARTLSLHREDGRALASSVEVRIRGRGLMSLQRGDHLRVRVKPVARQRVPAPVAAEMQLLRLVSRQPAHGVAALSAGIRADTHVLLADSPAHTRGLIPGLAMGDRSAMPLSLTEAMRTASLSHLSAISGMHIAVLVGIVTFIVPGRGILRIGALAAALTAILLIAGPTPSVLRSVTMAGIGAWGLISRRSSQGLSALMIAAIIMLYADPWNARSVSFSLSIMATMGVVIHGKRWQEWAKKCLRRDTIGGRIARMLHALLSVPLAAQIWVMPVIVLIQPQLPLWGVGANAVVSPIVAPLTVLSLAVCVSAPLWPGLSELLAHMAEPLCAWVDTVARGTAALPGASLSWPEGIDGALLWCVLLLGVSGGIKVAARVGHWRAAQSPALTIDRGEHGAT